MDKYGAKLKKIRAYLDIDKNLLANFLNISEDTLTHIESGTVPLKMEYVEKICLFYGLGFEIFFEDNLI